ncbi:MAG: hypothetical protein ABSB11_11850 [Sedimentisphaerales bacterium]|jgi:hypothetical protein
MSVLSRSFHTSISAGNGAKGPKFLCPMFYKNKAMLIWVKEGVTDSVIQQEFALKSNFSSTFYAVSRFYYIDKPCWLIVV